MALSELSKSERAEFEECLWYLNLAEMRAFCAEHQLPMYIHVERADGRLKKTGDRDRKDVVLERIRDFAVRGVRSGPTVYAASVVADGPLPARLTASTRLRYNQYEKKNPRFVETMQRLTDGSFRLGMIARLVLRDFWTAGVAPTMREFADEWLRATEDHDKPRPEGAYLADLHRGIPREGWKATRVQKAKRALALLRKSVG